MKYNRNERKLIEGYYDEAILYVLLTISGIYLGINIALFIAENYTLN